MLRSKPFILFLDADTVDLGDLDLSSLRRLGSFRGRVSGGKKALPPEAAEAEALISNKFWLGEKEMKGMPKLRLIAVAATGTNNVDLEAARRRGIAVANVPGYSTPTVVEHTLLFLLAFGHRLLEQDRAVKAGAWSRSAHFALLDFPYSDLAGKRLGILGYGAIGRRVARVARALGMEVHAGKLPGSAGRAEPKREPLKALLAKSDFVSLHCPLTETTRNLIDRKTLSWMKPDAYLLNLARGPIVEELAVAEALRKGRLAGYGADVLVEEPPRRNHPLLARDLRDKVLLTPHVAWASRESRQRLVEGIAKNISAFLSGKKLHRVD